MTAAQAEDEISRSTFSLLTREPFYAHVLAGMPREVSSQVQTAAVAWNGQQVKLLVNADYFVTRLTPNQRVAVLKHEVLHVAFRHLFRQADRDPEIDNLAADLVVNQLVAPWPLPKGAVLLQSFPDLRLEPDQTVEHYYAALITLYREMQKNGFQRGAGDGLESDGAGGEVGGGHGGRQAACARKGRDEKRGTGKAGRIAGLPEWARKTKAPISAVTIAQLLIGSLRGDHSLWGDGKDSLATGVARHAVGSLLIRARDRIPAHLWGTLSAAMQSALAAVMAEREPKVDWRRALRIFCAASGKTRIRHSLKRISKRYGTRPGMKIQRFQRLLIAVDTSGSISQPLLERFFVEIHGVWQAGATITVVECDAEVKRHYDYRGKAPQVVVGGGGTAFEPVFLWMAAGRPFDGCIYLTDSYGPNPTTRPQCRLLWAVPEGFTSRALPFGETLYLPG